MSSNVPIQQSLKNVVTLLFYIDTLQISEILQYKEILNTSEFTYDVHFSLATSDIGIQKRYLLI